MLKSLKLLPVSLLLAALSWSTVPVYTQSTPTRAEAIKLTGQRKLDEAKNVYLDLARLDPDTELPYLARFLKLTAQAEELDSILTEFEGEGMEISPPLKARAYAAAGLREQASQTMDASVKDLELDPRGVSIKARLLDQPETRQERDSFLATITTEHGDAEARKLAFDLLMTRQQLGLLSSPEIFYAVMESGIKVINYSREYLVKHIDPIIISAQMQPDYLELREGLLNYQGVLGPGATWFIARLYVREELFGKSAEVLKNGLENLPPSRGNQLLAQEYANVLRSLGNMSESHDILRKITSTSDDPEMILEMAQASLALQKKDIALEELKSIKVEELNVDKQRLYWIGYMDAAASLQLIDEVIAVYPDAMQNQTDNDFDVFHKIIFSKIIETAQHNEIEAKVRQRFEEEPGITPAVLWRLAAESAAQARRVPNQIEALYRCVEADPNDFVALRALGGAVYPVASNLIEVDKSKLLVPEKSVQALIDVCEQAMLRLSQAMPYDPTPYEYLIELYEKMGYEDVAERIIAIQAEESKNPRVIGNAAYALALNGYPDRALPLYERALEIDPNNADLAMNRASCLTRLDRFDEAGDIYKAAMIAGYNGKTYHIHEMIGRIWSIEEHMGRKDAFPQLVDEMLPQLLPEWRPEFLFDVANIYINKDEIDRGLGYFERVFEETEDPEVLKKIYEEMIRVYFRTENYEKALEILEEAQKASYNDSEASVGFGMMRADVLEQLGKREDSLAQWRYIATNYPHSINASMGLFAAARRASSEDDQDSAKQLFQLYLDTSPRNAEHRDLALEAIGETATP